MYNLLFFSIGLLGVTTYSVTMAFLGISHWITMITRSGYIDSKKIIIGIGPTYLRTWLIVNGTPLTLFWFQLLSAIAILTHEALQPTLHGLELLVTALL